MNDPDTCAPSSTHIAYAFKKLPTDDPMLTYLVDAMIRYSRCDATWNVKYTTDENWPRAYLLAFARKVSVVIGGVMWEGEDMDDHSLYLCDYHENKTEEERKRCNGSEEEK